MNRRQFLTAASLASASAFSGCMSPTADFELLNVSYDPTRELYRKINRMYAESYKPDGKTVRVRQSHGGSGSQARSVIDGIPADVVTLAMEIDIDNISAKGLIAKDWKKGPDGKLGSLPYHSTIVFVVRKGNPFGIKDWPDLLNPGVKIITANPKTGGGAKLALLGAWGAAKKRLEEGKAGISPKEFITEMYRRVPVLDTGARGATVTFARKNIGDVHLTWENEAYLEERELKDAVEIIHPEWSIRAEPHVALVDANVDRKGTRTAATEYLKFLFQRDSQKVIAEAFFRPNDAGVMNESAKRFKSIKLFRADEPEMGLGDWKMIQKDFFAEGGIFDQIYSSGR